MRHIFFFALFFFAANCVNAQLLWYEDFLGEADGAQVGTASGTPGGTWSTTNASVSRQDMPIANEILVAENTGVERRWETNTINISSAGYAIISSDVWSAAVDASDYLQLYYRVDGGPEILFYELAGGNGLVDFEPATPASAIVSGNTLQVVARFRNNTRTILFWTFNSLYGIDNVTVTRADILYSRKSGTWTDMAGGFGGTGTWSTNRSGTPACGCVPLNDIVAVIQNGHTVTLPTSQIAVGGSGTPNLAPGAVDVESGGILRYNVNGVTLGIQQGLMRVRSGGTVNSSSAAITGEQVSFNEDVGGATLQVDAGGTMAVEDFVLGTNASNLHYFSGGGTLTITDDILIEASDGTLTNNRSASFTVTDDLDFNGDNSTFVNNTAMTISDDILMDANNSTFTNNAVSLTITDDLNFNSDNSVFTNNATTSIGDIVATDANDDDNTVVNSAGATLNLGGITANDADLDITNSGTITQSGNFSTLSTGDTNLDNLATGVWNWTLTPNITYDTDVATVLNLTTAGNIFNYSGAGAQRIIPTTYHHITLSNSGAKDGNNASFAVQGNWTVSGTATFTEGTGGTVTFNGSVAQTIINAAGETFYNLTLSNSSGASPELTLNGNVTVSNIMTMTDGNVNLNGNTFLLTRTAADALSHSLASAAGWMYGGSFARVRPGGAPITEGTVHSFFPLGSASDWRPFFAGQNNVAATAGTMTVTHTNSTSTSIVAYAESIVRRHNSYWTPRTTAVGGTYTLRAGGTNFGTIGNASHLRMSTSSGVVGTHAAGSGGPTDWRVNRTAVSLASLNANHFHVASTNAGSSPLPIELLSFSAQLKNNLVELKWSTASETNNDFFTIERASDPEQFDSIIEHDGMGTSKDLNNYKVIDPSPLYGRSYYRLKQTDFDGKFSYSAVRTVDYEGPEYATLTAFPNPSKGNLSIRIEGLKEAADVPVQIINVHGQPVYEKTITVKTPGVITEEIWRNTALPAGLYIVKAGNTLYLTQKIVVE